MHTGHSVNYSLLTLIPYSFSFHLDGDPLGLEGEILSAFHYFLIIKLAPYTIVTLKHI